MSLLPIMMFALAALEPAGASAADPAAPPAEHRLSPEEVEKVLEEAARKRHGQSATSSAPSEDSGGRAALPVHGEVGFSIGTGGYRAAHGTAVIGLPGDGRAIVSVGTSRLPGDDFHHPYR